ncbi:MAG: GNAT family N-acetyltransferase [Ruminococcaceae bacterium]|nr:GNAT family N-acetyltransferase [Oscillospiraceae bacterium]
MISFFDLNSNEYESAAGMLPLPKKEALEIIESFAESGADAAVSGAFGCLLVRIYDAGEYLFSYPYPLTESADESGAVEEVAQYALREGLPLVFFDVPRESLPILLMGFRHADVDAEDESADTYRVTIKSECSLMKKIPEITSGDITLRELVPDDKKDYAEICLDVENNKYWGYDFREDNEEADAEYFIKAAMEERRLGTAVSFAVIYGGDFIGEASLYAFDCRGGAEAAIRILPKYQGRGLSENILTALFAVCKKMGLIRLYAEALCENKPSVAFCSKYMERISDEGGRAVFIKNLYELNL